MSDAKERERRKPVVEKKCVRVVCFQEGMGVVFSVLNETDCLDGP